MEKTAKKNPKWNVGFVDCSRDDSREECTDAGFTEDDLPQVFFHTDDGGIEPFVSPRGSITTKALQEFIQFRSEPIAAAQDKVTPFRAEETFLAIKLNKNHIVLRFHQSWDEQSKQMKKHFQKAAMLMSQKSGDFEFVDVDCGKLPKVCAAHEVENYPSVKVMDATKRYKVVEVEEPYDYVSIMDFLGDIS